MPRPPRGCGVLYLLRLLGELEERVVMSPVRQFQIQHLARVGERGRRGAAGVRLDGINRIRGARARHLDRPRIGGGDAQVILRSKDRQALVSAQVELDRDGLSRLRAVPDRRLGRVPGLIGVVVDRLEEARPAVVDRHGEAARGLVVVSVGGLAVDRRGTRREEAAGGRRAGDANW